MTETEAFEAMLAHHRSLTEGVNVRVAALGTAVAANAAFEARAAELVAYLAEEVLPHAQAEERTVYQAASQKADLVATVQSMTAEHRRLADLSEKLARAGEGQEALVAASTIGSLFASHVDKENDLLLPRLRADNDLARLLEQMHDRLEGAGPEPQVAAASAAGGPLGLVLALLLQAAKALSDVGQGDRACRLVASAWAAVRGPRPDLAVRVTAALHGLARTVAAEPVRFAGRTVGSGQAEVAPADRVLDVRALAPAQRHEVIFASYAELAPGAGFILVNDHDPKPLRYQFEAEHTGQFTWDYREEGPAVWRVRIGRPAVVGAAK
jgi:uncharacterized protein (DUF2249 family)